MDTYASPIELRLEVERHQFGNHAIMDLHRTEAHLEKHRIDLVQNRVILSPLLELEADKEMFRDHAKANALLTREYRKPFVVPSEAEV